MKDTDTSLVTQIDNSEKEGVMFGDYKQVAYMLGVSRGFVTNVIKGRKDDPGGKIANELRLLSLHRERRRRLNLKRKRRT